MRRADNCPDDVELHRPYIDESPSSAHEMRKEMHRVPEVIDCWFDSGAMPFAQHHYPFENKEPVRAAVPGTVHFRGCRPDTRMVLLSACRVHTAVQQSSIQNVIVLGHVQDENGQKMSKSKGNAVDPFDALRNTEQMQSAGISTSTVHHGCRTVSTEKPYRKDSVSSWVLCGTPMHSLYCMQTLTISMQQNILEYDKSMLLWINGCCPRLNPAVKDSR